MSEADQTIMRVRNLHRWLGQGEARHHVLRGLDLDLRPQRTYAIVGPSGCGKSTLLYLLGLLDYPDAGEIWLDADRVDAAPEAVRTGLRGRHLGFVFQFHFLLAEFTAQENIALVLRKQGTPPAEAMDRAAALLAEVGLAAKARRRGNQLSGGERQRVAVARALANHPRLVLADEPTGNLDAANSEALFDLFQGLSRSQGRTFVCVTHNPDLARRCDESLAMLDGRFVP